MAKNIFNSVQIPKNPTNTFDLSHTHKLTGNLGKLYPTLCLDCVPGDKIKIGVESLVRFAPLVSPVYARMDVYFHTFAIPYRLLWANWPKWATLQKTTGAVVPAFPTVTIATDGSNYTDLMDYLGIPTPPPVTGVSQDEEISAMEFAAYMLVHDTYYRDENLVPKQIPGDDGEPPLVDGDNSSVVNGWVIQKRAYEHDYFTSALPFAQKGAAVSLPIATSNDVPVKSKAAVPGPPGTTDTWTANVSGGGTRTVGSIEGSSTAVADGFLFIDGSEMQFDAATVNNLRLAVALQKYLERTARGGTRYIEWIKTMFNVKSSDARLQRPEFISGSKSPVVISEILQTSETGTETPQGNMAGHGVAVTSGRMGTYYCEEHCFIMTIMSVMPKTAYQNGIPKQFLKTKSIEQYLNPLFASLGEQPIENREVYAFTDTGDEAFGYLPIYAEYRFRPNRVSGQFKSSLAFWTLTRRFASLPGLNAQFIECEPATDIYAVDDLNVDHLYVDVMHHIKANRQLPYFGNPGSI